MVRALFAALMAVFLIAPLHAQELRGVTSTEIRIGQTMPYSGPVSAFGTVGKGEAGYFAMVNEKGGINGRKVNLLSLDDSYAPPKTVEQTRKLVEQDNVALIFSTLGTAHNASIAKYLQTNNVPQLFIATGASKFGDPAQYPMAIMGIQAPFRSEARLYARHALAAKPDATFAILQQNDDFGRDYVAGIKDVLGANFDARVKVATYEVADPTIDSQIVLLKASGADLLLVAATPKFGAQAIRKVYELGWKPAFYIAYVSTWVSSVMEPAGLEKGIGIVSSAYAKDPNDPEWANDEGVKQYRAFLEKYVPGGDLRDANYVNAYLNATAMEHVLRRAGNDLSAANIMKIAQSIDGLAMPMLLPGIKASTSATNHSPIRQMQLMRFDGKQWVRFGAVLTGE